MNTQKSELIVRLLGVGWYVGICIGGGALAGYWLDRWLGTDPLITMLGVLLGVVFAMIGVYRMLAVFLGNPDSGK